MLLREIHLSESVLPFDEAMKLIKQDCQPILKLILKEKKFLWRGMHNKNDSMFSPHPTNRKPVNSPQQLHDYFNHSAALAFGIKNVRNSSVFATASRRVAGTYGTSNLFFPKGKFEYIWSNQIKDSYIDEMKLTRQVCDRIQDKFNVSSKIDPEELVRMWHNNTLEEIYGADDESVSEFMGQVFEGLYRHNEGLKLALSTEHEILFYKSDGYYTVPARETDLDKIIKLLS